MPDFREARRREPRLAPRVAAVLLWTAFVWGNSLVAGPASSAQSGLVASLLAPFLHTLGITDANAVTFMVRKCAHFGEYAVLALLARRALDALPSARTRRLRLVPALYPLAVAVADETIQRFVPGRAGQPRDVLIDFCGACFALACLALWCRRHPSRA
ncbi:VanZ family protein [Olsenella phocaeensis]|uniref:VanZ family protein n=1 Tax=Olsenella phocaeensis TaxID=1852385 RepID=UPI003A942991